ncbi:Cytochrome b-c1 complex subunit 7 [Tulasnella sp. 419]|nr:Cytochrome b-c1 complex subunit 7 [Tulasnella sp. 418]KAG8969252.1 Cytochrome b-c1 complex subunit 7 [Tulasnella sp. 419]
MFGPLGISLAPQIQKSRTLSRYLVPLAQAYARAVGHRKVGVRYDDLLVEERPDVQKALGRLSDKESYDRIYRLKRCIQQSILHTDLPKDQWLDPKDDIRYLAPIVKEVGEREAERVAWDTADVEVVRK